MTAPHPSRRGKLTARDIIITVLPTPILIFLVLLSLRLAVPLWFWTHHNTVQLIGSSILGVCCAGQGAWISYKHRNR